MCSARLRRYLRMQSYTRGTPWRCYRPLEFISLFRPQSRLSDRRPRLKRMPSRNRRDSSQEKPRNRQRHSSRRPRRCVHGHTSVHMSVHVYTFHNPLECPHDPGTITLWQKAKDEAEAIAKQEAERVRRSMTSGAPMRVPFSPESANTHDLQTMAHDRSKLNAPRMRSGQLRWCVCQNALTRDHSLGAVTLNHSSLVTPFLTFSARSRELHPLPQKIGGGVSSGYRGQAHRGRDPTQRRSEEGTSRGGGGKGEGGEASYRDGAGRGGASGG